MEKLYLSKTKLKTAGEVNTHPSSHPLDPPQAISYKSHQNSLAYFSHLALFVLFIKRQTQKGGGA